MKTLILSLFICSVSLGAEVIDLGTFGGNGSYASDINDSGQILGWSWIDDADNAHAFVREPNGEVTFLYPFRPYAINNAGKIAGVIRAQDGRLYPAIYDHGTITILGSLGGVDGNFVGTAIAINDVGGAAGYAVTKAGDYHAFLFDGTSMIDLGCTPDANRASPNTYASGLNNSGQVVGFQTYKGQGHAFLYDHGKMRSFNSPIPWTAAAFGINNSGQIVGYAIKGGVAHGFLFSQGVFSDIMLGDTYSVARAINEHGQVVGLAYVKPAFCLALCYDVTHAFLFQNGLVFDLNDLAPSNLEVNWASGINVKGQIVGSAIVNGEQHAFLFNP